MPNYIEVQRKPRAVLIGVTIDGERDSSDDASLHELQVLTESLGYEVLHTFTQRLHKVNNESFIGSGKVAEISAYCKANAADAVVFDTELSPSHVRHLEDAFDIDVFDRSLIIIKIFAARARTAEGKLQVRLAEQMYVLPRLTGSNKHLSRLVGGVVGARGPGESKLEHERRVIKHNITRLKRELEDVKRHRRVSRKARERGDVTQVAIIGYTNAGKSTLLNRLTASTVEAADAPFVTLDPTARAYRLPDGRRVVLSDTVGFIRRLPTNLIKAFASTLEEAALADCLVHVIDASSPDMTRCIEVVDEMLAELDAADKPRLTIYNKCDAVDDMSVLPLDGNSLCVSCKTGFNVDAIPEALERLVDALDAYR